MHLATCNARTTLLSRHGSFLMSFCRNRGREGVRPAAGKHRPLRVMILLPLALAAFTFANRSCDGCWTGPEILAASESTSRASLIRFSFAYANPRRYIAIAYC